MSVVARKGKRATVYWVATSVPGREQPYWRRSGTDRRAADRLDAELKRQVKAGTFQPEHRSGAVAVRTYANDWLSKRQNRTKKDDAQRIRDFVLCDARDWFASMRLDDVRPRHIIQLVREIRAEGRIGEKSLSNTYGAVRTMFRDARIDELVTSDPCVLPRGEIRRGDLSREVLPYSKAECWTLTHDEKILESVRVLNALMIFGALREGEGCGRRWRNWDRSASPLGCLTVD